jgi:DNA polymerase-3 subunit delta'
MSGLFADLLGQNQAVALLDAALQHQRLAPAYLFVGPNGVGRRRAALRFLEGVLAGPHGSSAIRRRLEEGNHPDLLWVEPTYSEKGQLVPASKAAELGVSRRAAPQVRLEQIREVSRFLARRAVEAPGCLVVLEGAEAMAEGAANALLKTLEEPGDGLLILLTAAPDQLLSTIRSRCQQIPFARLTPALIEQVLASTGAAGAGSGDADPAELIELAAGSPGALLAHRQQWQALPEGIADRLRGLAHAPPEPLVALELARDLCEALDGEQQLWLLDWWQLVLWRQATGSAQVPLRRSLEKLRRLEKLRSHLKAYVQPRLAWEVTLLELASSSH